MDEEMITIVKKPGVKNCVRINNQNDIKDCLRDVVRIEKDTLILDCLEGEERVPLGSVIAYEKLKDGKMNVWNKSNWKETTREENGVFYEIPKPNKAIRVTQHMPQYIIDKLKGKLKILPDDTYQMDVGWGIVSCACDNGYLIIYGEREDGSLDVNFLTNDTPSFKEYYVLDENNNIVQSLEEYDMKIKEEISSNMKL